MAMIVFCALSGFGFSRLMSAIQCAICSPVYALLAFLIVKPQAASIGLFVLCVLAFQIGYFVAVAPILSTLTRRFRSTELAERMN